MENLKDEKTKAYINMVAVLGALAELCDISPEASALANPEQPVMLAMAVKNGPAMTWSFEKGICKAYEGKYNSDILLTFGTCLKFNRMVDGDLKLILPAKGYTPARLKFLTKNFMGLTDILEKRLREPDGSEEDEDRTTVLLLHVIADALPQIANYDAVGRFSASNMEDGTVVLSVRHSEKVAFQVESHSLKRLREIPEKPSAIMEFKNLKVARAIFDGRENALACMGLGLIEIRGRLGMVDNLNRMLDRVSAYLG